MDKYCVFGHPIAHSKSPQIHQAFAKQTKQSMSYTAELAPLDGFTEVVRQFFHQGGMGCNITVPFKLEAYQFASVLSERARRAGAVNTLIRQNDGTVLGDNTDGFGLVSDLKRNQVQLEGKTVLILGAGGAVRGILQPFLQEKPLSIHIANRTESKAIALATEFHDLGQLTGSGWQNIPIQAYDVVINGTSASLQGDIPPIPSHCFSNHTVCYDMMYAATQTPFLTWVEQFGVSKQIDGLGMLVAQAAESFRLWRGIAPNWEIVFEQLRHELTS